MSPVIGIGPTCHRCHRRPLWLDGLCSPCWRLIGQVERAIYALLREANS